MRLWIALLFSVVASAQTAVWPGSAATDSQLLVGANLCQTRLSQPINDTTSTTIFVTNSSVSSPYCFVVNQEVQVDNEFMKVTSVGFGQMTVTRGFDYSTASTHQINAPVVNNVAAAWYHNALAKEIESIEAWLAAGGGGGGGGGVCGVNGSIQYNNLGVCGGYAILPASVLPAATDAAQGAVQLPPGGTGIVLGSTISGVQGLGSYSIVVAGADPTGVADSASAINTALSAGYNNVMAPCGNFKIGSTVNIPAGVSFVDSGACTKYNYVGAGINDSIGLPTAYSSGGTLTGTGACLLAASGGGGTGGQLNMTVTSGAFTKFSIAAFGSGYTSEPTSWTYVSGPTCSTTVTTTGGVLTGAAAFSSQGAVQGQTIQVHVTKSAQSWVSGGDVSSIGFLQTDALVNANLRAYVQNFWTGLSVTNISTDNFGNTYELEAVNNKIGLHINGVSGHAAADSIYNNLLMNITSGATCPGGSPIAGTYYVLVEGDASNNLFNKANLENACVQFAGYDSGANEVWMNPRLEGILSNAFVLAGTQQTLISPYAGSGLYSPTVSNTGTGNLLMGPQGIVLDTGGAAGLHPIKITSGATTLFDLDPSGNVTAAGRVGTNFAGVATNSAFGNFSMFLTGASAHDNTASGYTADRSNVSGSLQTATGSNACFSCLSNSETANGYSALANTATAGGNSALGAFAGYGNVTGANNLFGGNGAGRFITGGSTANSAPQNSIFLGAFSLAKTATDVREIVLCYQCTGNGTDTTTIGTTNSTDVYIYGIYHFTTVYSAAGTPLPTCNAGKANTMAAVSDATGPTYNGAYTSGGTVHVPVFCDGTGWTTH